MTKAEVNFIWNELFKDKRIASLSNDLPSIIVKILKKIKKPTLEKPNGTTYIYRKTKEWSEALKVTKELFVCIVDNSSGCFLDNEFRNAPIKRR